MRLKIEWDYWHILLAVLAFAIALAYMLFRISTTPCPQCDERVPHYYKYCPQCGQQLRIDQVDKPK